MCVLGVEGGDCFFVCVVDGWWFCVCFGGRGVVIVCVFWW